MTFSPENYRMIKDVDIEKPTGCINSNPCNGAFSLTWTEDEFTFRVAKYGDGNGGDTKVKIANDGFNIKSFRNCLREWKQKVEVMDNE
jgi:hypothetical protein